MCANQDTGRGGEQARKPKGAVVVPLRRGGGFTEGGAARILESLTHLGTLPASQGKLAELERKMKAFDECRKRLDSAIETQAQGYCGKAGARAADRNDQVRMGILIAYSIYVTDRIDGAYEKAKAANECGVIVLFEKALDSATELLGERFFGLSLDAGARAFQSFHPVLSASLQSLGLGGSVIEMRRVHKAVMPEVQRRMIAAVDRIEGKRSGIDEGPGDAA